MRTKKRPDVTATRPGRKPEKDFHENTETISQNENPVKRRRRFLRMDEEQLQKPGYWAVLPAAVRYDPDLPASAKLLYAEISSLTDAAGYCFASNAYFQRLYELSERTVQRLLKALERSGYITIADGDGGQGRRRIYAGINPLTENPDKNVTQPRQKCRGNPDKNVGDNKKDINKPNKPPASPPGGERAKRGEPKTAPDWKPKRFEGFWKFYPKSAHKSKQAAIKAWDQLKPSDELIAEIGKALKRQMATDQWQREFGIPYPSTYLRQRRWEDELEETAMPEPDAEEGPEWI